MSGYHFFSISTNADFGRNQKIAHTMVLTFFYHEQKTLEDISFERPARCFSILNNREKESFSSLRTLRFSISRLLVFGLFENSFSIICKKPFGDISYERSARCSSNLYLKKAFFYYNEFGIITLA